MKSFATVFLAFSFFCASLPAARAENETKEFVMSCTYGVLAGTLVGAASLAFTSQPGESMFRVARGASLGLYAGIILGLYVVYIVPSLEPNPEEDPVAHLPFLLRPTFAANSGVIDGAQADLTIFHF